MVTTQKSISSKGHFIQRENYTTEHVTLKTEGIRTPFARLQSIQVEISNGTHHNVISSGSLQNRFTCCFANVLVKSHC